MSTRSLHPALRRLHHVLAHLDAGGVSDAQLLGRFVRQGDEAALELLVRRHGPMVLGVCRRVLRREQDAEDAFQAALLVLARKAGSIGARGSVGGYLYRVALRARAAARRRSRQECDPAVLPALPDPRPAPGPEGAELRGVLDDHGRWSRTPRVARPSGSSRGGTSRGTSGGRPSDGACKSLATRTGEGVSAPSPPAGLAHGCHGRAFVSPSPGEGEDVRWGFSPPVRPGAKR
jgi:hypothetical protein